MRNDLDNDTYVTVSHALTSGGSQQRYGDGSEETFVAAPLSHGSNHGVLAPALTATNDPSRSPQAQEVTRQYEAMNNAGAGVRRLTPTECERLQAWPDGWTSPDGKAPDSRRYAACGDGVTATVSEWIGRRLVAAGGGG